LPSSDITPGASIALPEDAGNTSFGCRFDIASPNA